MVTYPSTSYKKATQALNFFAHKKDGKINKMKAIKLIYLADRLHLRKYGRPIIGDIYWAMKLGPVGSRAKRVAELDSMPEEVFSYVKKYIRPVDERKHNIESLKQVELDLFSKTDLECFEEVYKKFADKDQYELRDITHQYAEWKKHERALKAGKKRVLMNYDDFFSDTQKGDSLFGQSKTDLNLAKESFDETQQVSAFFSR